MRNGDNEIFVGSVDNDNVVGKPTQHELLRATSTCQSRHRRQGNHVSFQEVERSIQRGLKVPSQSRLFGVIPCRGFDSLLRGIAQECEHVASLATQLPLHSASKLIAIDHDRRASVHLIEAAL